MMTSAFYGPAVACVIHSADEFSQSTDFSGFAVFVWLDALVFPKLAERWFIRIALHCFNDCKMLAVEARAFARSLLKPALAGFAFQIPPKTG